MPKGDNIMKEPLSKNTVYLAIFIAALLLYGLFASSSNDTISETSPPKTNESREKTYQEGISQITDKQWISAVTSLETLQKDNYKDSAALYNYAMARKYYEEEFMGTGIIERIQEHLKPVQSSLNKIDVNYSGLLAQDIASFRTEIENKQQKLQADLDASHKAYVEENKITPGCRKVRIGMTQDEATISMGKPYDINRTVGSYGTHEQWCYKGGIYLYFKNGVLTSWQD